MKHLSPRVFALGIVVLFAAITAIAWREALVGERYSMKMAIFGPAGALCGLFLLAFPDKFGRPDTTKDKVIVLSVFGIGVLAGVINWYLMDPGYFGR